MLVLQDGRSKQQLCGTDYSSRALKTSGIDATGFQANANHANISGLSTWQFRENQQQ